jgi:predicted nucleic acid-binding protein
MILLDTSVWIEHLRLGNHRLKALLFDLQDGAYLFGFLGLYRVHSAPSEHKEQL